MGLKNKGVFFSLDGLVAILIILIVILVTVPLVKKSISEKSIETDVIKTLSAIKIGEFDNNLSRQLISQGVIRDQSKSVLEQIGEFYVTNITLARSLANEALSVINTSSNLGLWFGDKLIYIKNTSSIEESNEIHTSSALISGVQEGKNVTGYSSRAFLTNNFKTSYFYFGGYVGDGNISALIQYNGTIKSAEIEVAINNNFTVFINDIYSGNFSPSLNTKTPSRYSLPISNLVPGNNIISFKGNSLFISGGYIKIVYDSIPSEYTERHYIPGIEGIINIYDGISFKSNISSVSISLHYVSPTIMLLTLGNETLLNESSNIEKYTTVDNSAISSLIDYDSIEEKTIPLRIGLKEMILNASRGKADVILITDLSASMNNTMENDSFGISRECDDPNIYNQTTKRISVAKCLDKEFIESILNTTGNRVGLVGFYGDPKSPFKGRVFQKSLTNNITDLENEIDSYNISGGTCICCSLNDAYSILSSQSNSSRYQFVISMTDGVPTHTCQASSGCTGTRTGLPSDEGLWLGNSGCYGGDDDCEVNDCLCASTNANWSSCRLNSLGATVYSIGFGPVSSCSMASTTLQNIATCGKGEFYSSNNASQLKNLYESIARDIIRLSYAEQISLPSSGIYSKLYPDSFIEINYSSYSTPYGIIISEEKSFDNPNSGSFSIPSNSRLTEAIAVSYSGQLWTSDVSVNNQSIYNLSEYGSNFILLGDPYSVNLPVNIINQSNTLEILNAISPENSSSGSQYNKIIYKIAKNIETYSDVSPIFEGCIWNIEFYDDTNETIKVPSDYNGNNTCSYSSISRKYEPLDSSQTSAFNLFKILDLDQDYKIDTKISSQNLLITMSKTSGVPYAWSTKVEARTWK